MHIVEFFKVNCMCWEYPVSKGLSVRAGVAPAGVPMRFFLEASCVLKKRVVYPSVLRHNTFQALKRPGPRLQGGLVPRVILV
jgi:hypothetical protein